MKRLLKKIDFLKLSPKKEITKLIAIVLIALLFGVITFLINKNWLYLAIGAGLSVIFGYLYLSRYSSMINEIKNENLNEFVILFSYFRIYINNGFNVYTALKEIVPFANPNLSEMLIKLIEEIDEDKSVKPFVNFAKNFDEIIVEEMMISIYQIIDDGEKNNYLKQFEFIFDKFSDILSEKNLRKKDSALARLSSTPLIGTCFLIIIITIGVVGVLGEMMNVI